jgi:hypothetical protein
MIIRPVEDSDREMIAGWIAREPSHEESTPEFYLAPNTKSVVYEDDLGPVFVVRYSSALRVDIDFADVEKERIRQALKQEFPAVAEQAKSQGFGEIIFNSVSKPLIAFCRFMGFRAVPDYRRTI